MVCTICRHMLVRQDGRFAKGTLDLKYEHHTNVLNFRKSVQQNCYICRALYKSLLVQLGRSKGPLPRQNITSSDLLSTTDPFSLSKIFDTPLRSTASLFVDQPGRSYRLEIDLHQDQARIQHTFYLEQRDQATASPDRHSVHVAYRARKSLNQEPHDTCHSQDYGTALQWLDDCRCYGLAPRTFYPARLLSLENLKSSAATSSDGTSIYRRKDVHVKLVETKHWAGPDTETPGYCGGNKEYVTLSHCWGGTVSHRLTKECVQDFVNGIPVQDLPRTFQDAVYFAASLREVGYLWIDSLCIIQDDKQDWIEQSAVMDRIYSETFLNLSATASSNSHGGFFRDGDLELLEEDQVILNIEGLPLAYRGKTPQIHIRPSDIRPEDEPVVDRDRPFLRLCNIRDVSFWDKEVDKGPVNTRGWVVQERLMSPRVLHFCHDQVGWECGCSYTEQGSATDNGYSPSVLGHRSRYQSIVEGVRPGKAKIGNGVATNTPTPPSPLELWAAVVDAYTKTAISFPQDKLIALSGLARVVASETASDYIAGLWRTNIAAQLLWRVESAFDSITRNFSHPATFPPEYRAPSFSWAAIDVAGHGIVSTATTDCSILITIESVSVTPLTDNEFGIVQDARLLLWGKLRQIHLFTMPKGRYCWQLTGRGDLDKERHTNVYLDCPARDADCIDNLNIKVWVLPVGKDESYSGLHKNGYLLCLLLRSGEERGTFKRIGMTKLSLSMDRRAMAKPDQGVGACRFEHRILEVSPGDGLPDGDYNAGTGMRRICLV